MAGELSTMSWFLKGLLFSVIMALSLYFHEMGHYRTLRSYYPGAKKPTFQRRGWRFWWSVEWPRGVLRREDELEVYTQGVFMGLFPLFLLLMLGVLWLIAGVGLYAWGCDHDLKEWDRLEKVMFR